VVKTRTGHCAALKVRKTQSLKLSSAAARP